MEQVRVCQVCGHINPSDDSTRCEGCWSSLAQAPPVPRADVERPSRRFRLSFWRKRYLLLILAVVFGFIAWKTVSLLDLVPLVIPPARATTGINSTGGPHTWDHARHDYQNTGFTPDQAPVPERIAWTFATAKPLVASPAVVGDRVYLATGDGRTVSLNAQTGRLAWEYRSGNPSNSTPAVTPNMVISVDRPGRVAALDRTTGEVIWERNMDNPITASPMVADGSVYIGSADRNLYALDAATGSHRWSFAADAWINSSAAYADGTVAVTSQDTSLYIVSAMTGRRQLIYDVGRGRSIGGSPVIQGDMVYFGTLDGTVWAIDRRAKTYPFQRTVLFWKATFYIWGLISAPVQKGTVWSRRVGGKIRLSVAATPDTVFAANVQGNVIALDALTGEERWKSDVGREITAAPTVAGQTVIVGAKDGLVVGLDRDSGEILWEFRIGGKITASPVVVGNIMYVASHDGILYAVTGS